MMRNPDHLVARCLKQLLLFVVIMSFALILSANASAQEASAGVDSSFALRTNLLWDATAEPNIAVEKDLLFFS